MRGQKVYVEKVYVLSSVPYMFLQGASGTSIAIALAWHRGVNWEIPGSALGSAPRNAPGNRGALGGAPEGAQENRGCSRECSSY